MSTKGTSRGICPDDRGYAAWVFGQFTIGCARISFADRDPRSSHCQQASVGKCLGRSVSHTAEKANGEKVRAERVARIRSLDKDLVWDVVSGTFDLIDQGLA